MKFKTFLIVGFLTILSISIVYSSEILNGNELKIASKTGINFDDKILLKSRQFIPEEGISQILKDKITARAPKKTHVLLQFNNIPTKEEKQELKNQGINLIAYIPKNTWFASVESDFQDKIALFPNIW